MKTDKIWRRKKGGAATITSADKQATSAIAIHRQDVKKLSPCGFIKEDVEGEDAEEDEVNVEEEENLPALRENEVIESFGNHNCSEFSN